MNRPRARRRSRDSGKRLASPDGAWLASVRNDRLYVRLWQPGRALRVHTEKLPEPPASVASVLSLPAAAGGRDAQDMQSTLAEFEIDGLDSVVEGNISMKVTVIE